MILNSYEHSKILLMILFSIPHASLRIFLEENHNKHMVEIHLECHERSTFPIMIANKSDLLFANCLIL